MSANCLNVHLNNVTMGNVTGDAVHKAFAVSNNSRADISKNHFYTDLSIHKCNSPMTIGYISENVMCDNVFGTELRYQIYLSGASNCIVANSSLSVNRDTFIRPNSNGTEITINANTGIRTEDAASCWFQNSYLYTNGNQRVGAYSGSDTYYYNMCVREDIPVNIILDNTGKKIGAKTKKHNRSYIGSDFSIPNHWFKFTGCDMVSEFGTTNYYFYEGYYSVVDPKVATHPDPCKSQYGEYWDNCYFETNTGQVVFRMYCSNDLPGGITIRNSYLENTKGTDKPPFRQCCIYSTCTDSNSICPVVNNCIFAKHGKTRVWTRFENDIFKNICRNESNNWKHLVTYDGNIASTSNAVNMSNSYGSGCYKISGGKPLAISFTY